MNEPPTIEHNPNEKRPTNRVLWAAFVMVALLWLHQWWFNEFDWKQIALGFITGGMFIGIAIEKTGNKLPDWMR